MTTTLQIIPNSGQIRPVRPIVFFGTEDFSLATLEALVHDGYTVAAVVTKPDSKQGRGQKLTSPLVKVFAERLNIPVWQPIKLTDITEKIRTLKSPVGVLVSYGKIIPQSIIDLFSPGIINIHPSLLPKYRGPSPVESAILHADSVTGVSIMQLSASMDAGPVYIQRSLDLKGNEEINPLYDKLSKIGIELLLARLPVILSGELQPTIQNNAAATYCQLIRKSDGVIDWAQSAQIIECKVRAYRTWPKTRTTVGSHEVIIAAAHVANESATDAPGTIAVCDEVAGALSINTGEGTLAIDIIQPIGKKEMPVKAFLSGYKSRIAQ